jgi:hypothetical protein
MDMVSMLPVVGMFSDWQCKFLFTTCSQINKANFIKTVQFYLFYVKKDVWFENWGAEFENFSKKKFAISNKIIGGKVPWKKRKAVVEEVANYVPPLEEIPLDENSSKRQKVE